MLIILGTDLDPAAVTEAIGLVPSQAWRKGEQKRVTGEDGKTRFYENVYEWGGWKLWLPKEMSRAMSLPEQLEHWLKVMQGRLEEVQVMKAQGHTVEINCYISSKVYTLYVPSKLQSQLGELGIDLEVGFFSARPKPKAKRRRPMKLPPRSA